MGHSTVGSEIGWHGITEEFARRLIHRRLLPDGEFNDGVILAETALAGIPMLVTGDHHLLDIEAAALHVCLREADLKLYPWRTRGAFSRRCTSCWRVRRDSFRENTHSCESGFFLLESKVSDENPGNVFRRVRRTSGIVILQPVFEVRGKADVSLAGMRFRSEQIDVVHLDGWPASRSSKFE